MTDTRPLFIRLTLPAGLEDALEGLAREVLRHQPENILEFAADHFDLQLRKRSESGLNYDKNIYSDIYCLISNLQKINQNLVLYV